MEASWLTSILRTASSMAADVAAISLSTTAPSSSCRTSRLLGFSSWEDGKQVRSDAPAAPRGGGGPRGSAPHPALDTHLAQLKDALQGTAHQAWLCPGHPLPVLQLLCELQRPRPALPAAVQ